MPVSVKFRHDRQIIVPLRFARAVTGPAVADAPDIDDRGFAMGARPGTWGQSKARGPMFGITEGDTVRIKLVREDIDDTAPLFVTSTNTSVIRIVTPAAGQRVPVDNTIRVQGVKDFANVPVAIQVRLGNPNGPIISEIEPHVFQLINLRVRIHLCNINGVSTSRTEASVRALFNEVNAIWRPAGVQFPDLEFVTTVINGFANPGQVTTNLGGSPPSWNEFSRLINTNISRTRINIYCVVDCNDARGLTFDHDVARPAPGVTPTSEGFGIMLVDAADANDFAHELGHYLDLDDHTDDLGTTPPRFREDIWARRCLMFRFNPYGDLTHATPAQAAFRNDTGYGMSMRGSLITLKNLPGDNRDDEVNRARRRARNPN
jgi:hypothetical protein